MLAELASRVFAGDIRRVGHEERLRGQLMLPVVSVHVVEVFLYNLACVAAMQEACVGEDFSYVPGRALLGIVILWQGDG